MSSGSNNFMAAMSYKDSEEPAMPSQEQQDRMDLNAFMWKFLKQTNRLYMEQSIVHNIGKDIVSNIYRLPNRFQNNWNNITFIH